ncbi:hypothetical protein Cni_G12890 [Canna indica]|uniref:PB1 domain-containing protein n=1 Tax=Canna indica TaxID=4628 RepID=A0AAQ3QB14_9LILI|nr:hypothetical protein Cni_G12890 [Canna indica]
MMRGSSSSSSPYTSSGPLQHAAATSDSLKFLCSYGGKILPRYPDGKLRYVGGHTRVLSVRRSIAFAELQVKLMELCGWGAVSIRCQLPADDMDALVSVTSDEDLVNVVNEYDVAAGRDRLLRPPKIRAFLLPKPSDATMSKSATAKGKNTPSGRAPVPAERCVRQSARPRRWSWSSSGRGRSLPPPGTCASTTTSVRMAMELRGRVITRCTMEITGSINYGSCFNYW